WQGEQAEILRCERGMDFLAAGVLLAYPIIYTFMAFDLIMALDPFWYSSLFGGYFFVSTLYLGLAGLAVVAALLRRNLGDLVISISTGLWIERYVLVVPSLWSQTYAPFGWIEVGITFGFLGAAGLSYVFFLQNFPLIPYARISLSPASQQQKDAEQTA